MSVYRLEINVSRCSNGCQPIHAKEDHYMQTQPHKCVINFGHFDVTGFVLKALVSWPDKEVSHFIPKTFKK